MSNVITPPQCRHLIEVFEALESGQMQALVASGLLTDLRRCAAELDPMKVDHDQFQRILGLNPSVFKVKMGGPENTDQITAALGFPFNNWITQANFPLKPSKTPWEDEIEIVDPDRSFNFDECSGILSAAGLLVPTYEHGIRFAEQYGKTTTSTKKPFITFPHEPWQDPDRYRCVVGLRRRPGYRLLLLRCPDFRFHVNYVLAGVRPRKQQPLAA